MDLEEEGKKLGIPTANLDMTPEIKEKMVDLVSGVYFGWAEFMPCTQTDKNEGFEYYTSIPMVMSIGFNPFFNNEYKTAEAHIMKKFEHDFYDSKLKVSILGFIRNEADFLTFSHLIEAIHNDVQVAKDILNSDSF
jgi:riboflavin kinase